MLTKINTPYRPELCNRAGTYRLSVGGKHYYGSTARLGSRRSNHRAKLRRGEHPNKAMQAAFDAAPDTLLFTVIAILPKQHRLETKELRAILRKAEQKLLDSQQFAEDRLNASSSATHNSNISETLKAMWADPTFRESQKAAIGSRKGVPVSQETRRKMSEAKRGYKNHNARACVVEFGGKRHHFGCVTDAAKHFGVKQQVMHGWLQGLFAFPGSGSRKPRSSTQHLAGMTGHYLPESGIPNPATGAPSNTPDTAQSE